MAANMTDWLENQVANAASGEGTLTAITSTKLRLHTADPTDAGTANELGAGGGYPTGGIAVTWAALSTLTGSNNAFTIPNCPAGTITHFSVWDGTTNTWFWGTYSKTLSVGKDLEFSGGEFDIVFQADITEALAGNIWDAFTNVGSYSNPAPRLGAFTASPGTTGSITNESADGGYSRPTPSWGTASGGAISINANASYGTWAGSETITHLGLIDNTASELLFFDAPTGGSVSMSAGEILRSKSGEFTFTCT